MLCPHDYYHTMTRIRVHVIFTCHSDSMQTSQVSCVRHTHLWVIHAHTHGQATLTDLLGLSAAQYLVLASKADMRPSLKALLFPVLLGNQAKVWLVLTRQ